MVLVLPSPVDDAAGGPNLDSILEGEDLPMPPEMRSGLAKGDKFLSLTYGEAYKLGYSLPASPSPETCSVELEPNSTQINERRTHPVNLRAATETPFSEEETSSLALFFEQTAVSMHSPPSPKGSCHFHEEGEISKAEHRNEPLSISLSSPVSLCGSPAGCSKPAPPKADSDLVRSESALSIVTHSGGGNHEVDTLATSSVRLAYLPTPVSPVVGSCTLPPSEVHDTESLPSSSLPSAALCNWNAQQQSPDLHAPGSSNTVVPAKKAEPCHDASDNAPNVGISEAAIAAESSIPATPHTKLARAVAPHTAITLRQRKPKPKRLILYDEVESINSRGPTPLNFNAIQKASCDKTVDAESGGEERMDGDKCKMPFTAPQTGTDEEKVSSVSKAALKVKCDSEVSCAPSPSSDVVNTPETSAEAVRSSATAHSYSNQYHGSPPFLAPSSMDSSDEALQSKMLAVNVIIDPKAATDLLCIYGSSPSSPAACTPLTVLDSPPFSPFSTGKSPNQHSPLEDAVDTGLQAVPRPAGDVTEPSFDYDAKPLGSATAVPVCHRLADETVPPSVTSPAAAISVRPVNAIRSTPSSSTAAPPEETYPADKLRQSSVGDAVASASTRPIGVLGNVTAPSDAPTDITANEPSPSTQNRVASNDGQTTEPWPTSPSLGRALNHVAILNQKWRSMIQSTRGYNSSGSISKTQPAAGGRRINLFAASTNEVSPVFSSPTTSQTLAKRRVALNSQPQSHNCPPPSNATPATSQHTTDGSAQGVTLAPRPESSPTTERSLCRPTERVRTDAKLSAEVDLPSQLISTPSQASRESSVDALETVERSIALPETNDPPRTPADKNSPTEDTTSMPDSDAPLGFALPKATLYDDAPLSTERVTLRSLATESDSDRANSKDSSPVATLVAAVVPRKRPRVPEYELLMEASSPLLAGMDQSVKRKATGAKTSKPAPANGKRRRRSSTPPSVKQMTPSMPSPAVSSPVNYFEHGDASNSSEQTSTVRRPRRSSRVATEVSTASETQDEPTASLQLATQTESEATPSRRGKGGDHEKGHHSANRLTDQPAERRTRIDLSTKTGPTVTRSTRSQRKPAAYVRSARLDSEWSPPRAGNSKRPIEPPSSSPDPLSLDIDEDDATAAQSSSRVWKSTGAGFAYTAEEDEIISQYFPRSKKSKTPDKATIKECLAALKAGGFPRRSEGGLAVRVRTVTWKK